MSILSWFKHVTEDQGSAELMEQPLTFGKGEEQFRGLNMKDALDAHMAWTRRLEGKLNGSNQEALEVAKVASDCECALGKWIHGQAKSEFSGSNDYDLLKRIHADFHLKAGEILNNVINGERDNAEKNLKEIRFQSGNVQLALVRLYSTTQH